MIRKSDSLAAVRSIVISDFEGEDDDELTAFFAKGAFDFFGTVRATAKHETACPLTRRSPLSPRRAHIITPTIRPRTSSPTPYVRAPLPHPQPNYSTQ